MDADAGKDPLLSPITPGFFVRMLLANAGVTRIIPPRAWD